MSYSTTRNHHGYGGKFVDDAYGMGNVDSDEDYDPQEDDIADGQGNYGPYSTGYARSGPGDRKLDGTRDHRKKSQGNNNYDNDDYSEDDYDDDDDDYDGGYGNQDGQYGPYSQGKARSGPGDRRLDGHHDGRKVPGGNNPSGVNGYTKGGNNNSSNYGNQRRSKNNNNNRRRSNYNDNDSDDYNNNQQGNYGRYSQGKSRSGPGDRKLDGTRDHRKKSQGNNSRDDDDDNYNGNSGNYNNSNYGNQQGNYGPYSQGKARSGPGDRRLDGQHDGRKVPGGNNPSGVNGYTKNDNNRNRNRNYQNDNDDDNDNDDYGQNTRKQRNYSNNNNTGRQNRSGPGDRKLDGSKDLRKKPNRSDNYQN